MIVPVMKDYGIEETHIFANNFIYGNNGKILGVDPLNPLSKSGGKARQMAALNLRGNFHIIGDGYNDYRLKKDTGMGSFFAFTENVLRPEVCNKADHVLTSLDDYIAHINY